MVQDWSTEVQTIVESTWDRIVAFVPNVLGSVLILLVGAIIAWVLGYAVTRLLQVAKVQMLADQSKFTDVLKAAKLNADIAELSGTFVKWVVVLAFFVPAASTLQLENVEAFFEGVLVFVPKLVAIALLIMFGYAVADVVSKLVRATVQSVGSVTAKFAELFVKWTMLTAVGITTMWAIGVPQEFTVILFIGAVSMVALAAGLAFGLGAKDHANDLVKHLRSELKK